MDTEFQSYKMKTSSDLMYNTKLIVNNTVPFTVILKKIKRVDLMLYVFFHN